VHGAPEENQEKHHSSSYPHPDSKRTQPYTNTGPDSCRYANQLDVQSRKVRVTQSRVQQ
jgi:hypothetical protein